MSSFHVLLRLLLCIALVLYGSGPAAAAARMQMGTDVAAPAAASTDTASVAATSCHDATEEMRMAADQDPTAATNGAPASAQGSPDCCKATSCDCSCAQQVQVATTALAVGSQAPSRSTAVRPMKTGHASPALPHLIRPPIG